MPKPQINQLNDGHDTFLIRNAYGYVYKAIGSKINGKWVWNSQFITSSPNYTLDGTLVHKIPNHIFREYARLMIKTE